MSILTISRQYGSGGREIGRAVSKLCGYDYVDKERILADIRAAGPKWEEWAKELDEHCPSVWEKYDWSFRGFGALIQKAVLEHALRDNVVIMGRGANFLLKDIPHASRIRVQAPLADRIERIIKREGVDKETARWLCEKTDAERSCFIHSLYGELPDDAAHYDLVFDSGTQTLEEIIEIVKETLQKVSHNATDRVRHLLAMRTAAANVKAGIATNPRFFIPTLDVRYDGSVIELRGVTHSAAEHKQIEEAARRLSGGLPLRCKLHYRK